MRSLLCEPDGIILTIGETRIGFNSVPVTPVANEFPMGTRIIACYARHSHLSGRSEEDEHHHHVSYRLLGVSSVHASLATFRLECEDD